jgi:hypothetical protein
MIRSPQKQDNANPLFAFKFWQCSLPLTQACVAEGAILAILAI